MTPRRGRVIYPLWRFWAWRAMPGDRIVADDGSEHRIVWLCGAEFLTNTGLRGILK